LSFVPSPSHAQGRMGPSLSPGGRGVLGQGLVEEFGKAEAAFADFFAGDGGDAGDRGFVEFHARGDGGAGVAAQRRRIGDVVRDLPAFAAPVGDGAGRDARAFGGGVAADERGRRGD
jgi:hypothetical protein